MHECGVPPMQKVVPFGSRIAGPVSNEPGRTRSLGVLPRLIQALRDGTYFSEPGWPKASHFMIVPSGKSVQVSSVRRLFSALGPLVHELVVGSKKTVRGLKMSPTITRLSTVTQLGASPMFAHPDGGVYSVQVLVTG